MIILFINKILFHFLELKQNPCVIRPKVIYMDLNTKLQILSQISSNPLT